MEELPESIGEISDAGSIRFKDDNDQLRANIREKTNTTSVILRRIIVAVVSIAT